MKSLNGFTFKNRIQCERYNYSYILFFLVSGVLFYLGKNTNNNDLYFENAVQQMEENRKERIVVDNFIFSKYSSPPYWYKTRKGGDNATHQ